MNAELYKQWYSHSTVRANRVAALVAKAVGDGEPDPRSNVMRRMDASLEALIPQGERRWPPYVLDVGCGWASRVGQRLSSGKAVQLVGVDPLAATYFAIFDRMKVPAAHGMAPIIAEEIGAIFPPDSFDLVTCLDAIEKMLDPQQAILQMVRCAKPGASVVITSVPKDEPDRFWRASERDGMLVLSREGTSVVVSEALGARVEATTGEGGEVRAVARKPAGVLLSLV